MSCTFISRLIKSLSGFDPELSANARMIAFFLVFLNFPLMLPFMGMLCFSIYNKVTHFAYFAHFMPFLGIFMHS